MKRLLLCWLPLCCLVGGGAFAQADEEPAERIAHEAEAAEALGAQVQELNQQMRQVQQQLQQMNAPQGRDLEVIEEIVLRHINFSGGPEEIADWYDANKDDLVFDYLTQRFMLASDF